MKPMKDPLGIIALVKGIRESHEAKKKFFWPWWELESLIPFTRANAQWVFHGLHNIVL